MVRSRLMQRTDVLARFLARKTPWDAERSGVLLVSAGGLGDTVLFALVLPRFLSLAQAGETVTVLLRSDAAKMAFLFPPGVEVRTVDFKRFGRQGRYRLTTLAEMRDAHYRIVVSTDYLRHPYLDEALIRACACPDSFAMTPRPWPKHDRALTRNRSLYSRLFEAGEPRRDKVLRWTAFADWLTGTIEPPPRIRLPEALLPPPVKPERPTIMLQPFSAVTRKQSPPSLYLALMEALPDHDFVLLGAPNDLTRNPEFVDLLDRAEFDSSPFQELLPRLRGADLVVSVDTALMHLAAAAGVPTLCLASAAYVGEIVPYADDTKPDNVMFVTCLMPCEGCLGACDRPEESGMYPCVARIDRDMVVGMARVMLDLGSERKE